MMILLKVLGFQIFYYNHIIFLNQLSCYFMQIVFSFVCYSSLIAAFLFLCLLPILVVINFNFNHFMIMIPLTGRNCRTVFPTIKLSLPLISLLFQPFGIKGAVLIAI